MNLNIKLFYGVAILCLLMGCNDNDPDLFNQDSTRQVYKYSGKDSCGNPGVEHEVMGKELTDAGVDVICSTWGVGDSVDGPSDESADIPFCDNQSRDINIYKIHVNNLVDAEKIGFRDLKTLDHYSGDSVLCI